MYYTFIDLLFSLVGLAGLILLFVLVLKRIYRASSKEPMALVLGGLLSLMLLSGIIEQAALPLEQFSDELLTKEFKWALQIDHETEKKIDRLYYHPLTESIYSTELWVHSFMLLVGFGAIVWLSSLAIAIAKNIQENPPLHFKQNAIVAITVLLSVYLSVSALVTLPVITEGIKVSKTSDLTNGRLKSQLVQEFEALTENDSLIKKSLYENQRVNGLTAAGGEKSNAKRAAEDFLFIEIREFETKVNEVFDVRLPTAASIALSQIGEAEENNLTDDQRSEYRSDLYHWYVKQRIELINYLKERDKALMSIKVDIENISSKSQNSNDQDGTDANFPYNNLLPSNSNDENEDNLGTAEDQEIDNLVKTYLSKDQTLALPKMPATPMQPVQGSHLGVFSIIMSWLLPIESYSLVVIIGLIGFGFLGSIGSSFIKENQSISSLRKGPWIANFPKVLIGGFTAAIVVYLGIKGSLSLLSGGNSSDDSNNGYLLFFMAMVAAVYSESTWDWAKKRFDKTLNENT